ncbi:hypothetical protein [Haloferula sp.]|uniref:hypothetical protein n=1 Tax=Haloferula sp. TaxID=2497595 RepID=UPI003C73F744
MKTLKQRNTEKLTKIIEAQVQCHLEKSTLEADLARVRELKDSAQPSWCEAETRLIQGIAAIDRIGSKVQSSNSRLPEPLDVWANRFRLANIVCSYQWALVLFAFTAWLLGFGSAALASAGIVILMSFWGLIDVLLMAVVVRLHFNQSDSQNNQA